MWDFLKFVVLLALVIVCVLICFATSLFLKRQNVFIDFKCQYKEGERLGPAPCPEGFVVREVKDEERGCCPAEPCQDEEENSCESNDDLVDCKNIDARLDKLHEKRRGQKKASSRDRSTYSWSRGTISCCQGKTICEKALKNKCPSSAVKRKSGKAPAKQNRSRARKKCVSFRNSSSTCECSHSDSETSFENRRHSQWKSSIGRKKVDCLVLLDPSHVMHNRNQQTTNPHFTLMKSYNVLSNDPSSPHQVGNVENAPHQLAITDGKPPCQNLHQIRSKPAEDATKDEKISELLRPEQRHCPRSANNKERHLGRVQEEMQGQLLGSKFPMKSDSDDLESMAERKVLDQKRENMIDSEHSGVKLPPCSTHNLEKLREKRKERKRTLMKLQAESGRLEDNMREWMSVSSTSNVC